MISNEWRTSYYGYDGHGSVRLLTDATGAVTDTYILNPGRHITPRQQFATMMFGNDPNKLVKVRWFVAFTENKGFEFEKKPRNIYYYPGAAQVTTLFYGENAMRYSSN